MGRETLSWLVAPLVLVAVAAVQFGAVVTHDLSTWSGAGMGMFASIDNEQTRYVDVQVELGGTWFPVSGGVLGSRTFRRQVLPAASHLRADARDLLERSFTVLDDGRAVPATEDEGQRPRAVTVRVVGIELRGTADRPILASRTVREVTVDR